LYFRGIEVVPLWIADFTLENDTNPYTGLLRHFAILTLPENNLFGVENTSDLNSWKSAFDSLIDSTKRDLPALSRELDESSL
jgi:hypothetical protein